MTRTSLIAAVALVVGSAALAQTPPAGVATTTHATTATTTTTPAVGAKTVTKRAQVQRTRVAKTPAGRVVAVTTKSGKTLHYDCGKAGNKNKTACKN